LGSPTSNSLMPDGSRMIMYSYVQVQSRPESFIPIVGPLIGGADARSSNVVLMFDTRGILTQFSSSQAAFGSGEGIAAGSTTATRTTQPRVASPSN
jgi:hypothetical protein